MEFTKMQGIGNDYVYVDCFKEKVEHPGEVSKVRSSNGKNKFPKRFKGYFKK